MNSVYEMHNDGASRGSLQTYVTGFVLAVVLTIVPFWIVMRGMASSSMTMVTLVAFALVQVVIHLVFFLHMNGSSEQRGHRVAFIFAAIIVGILVGGSLWIMYHLNHNMMPMNMKMGMTNSAWQLLCSAC